MFGYVMTIGIPRLIASKTDFQPQYVKKQHIALSFEKWGKYLRPNFFIVGVTNKIKDYIDTE